MALLCGVSFRAQADPSLAEMVSAATALNPGLELAGAERHTAEALRRKSRQLLADPLRANLKHQTDAIGSELGYREWEGGVDLPLWRPGQANSYAREAAHAQEGADALHDSKWLEIAGEVRERLWAAAIARSEAEQAQAAHQVAEGLFSDVRRRVSAGELPRSDQLLAEKEYLLRQETMQQASHRADLAAQLFSRYTGFAPPPQPATEKRHPDSRIGEGHPKLRLALRTVERAQARRDRIGVERKGSPNLWLGAKRSKAEAGADYDSAVGVEVSLPLGSGPHAAVELSEAEAAFTQAQVELRALSLVLQDDLTRARMELERAATAVEQTQRRLTLADESLKLGRRAFDLGESDLVRLLQAQADALSARHDHQVRRLEYGLALARLNQALGVIPQ